MSTTIERDEEELAGRPRARIVAAATELFFARGYSGLMMDELASELGMSKKTLYVYFGGKDEVVRAVLERFAGELRAEADRLLADRQLSFAEKLRGFAQAATERLGRVRPEMLADLERAAPKLHRWVLELRAKHLPYIFGRFIEEGQLRGAVRDEVSPVFASEFYLHAMQGLMQGGVLQRLKTRPEAAFEQGLRIFFGGLLTSSGEKEYEKLFPR
jgi:Transcriptional regulator